MIPLQLLGATARLKDSLKKKKRKKTLLSASSPASPAGIVLGLGPVDYHFSLLSFIRRQVPGPQLSLKTQPWRLDVINEAYSSVDVRQVKPIDQQTNIDRPCELYNVSRADGCEFRGVGVGAA